MVREGLIYGNNQQAATTATAAVAAATAMSLVRLDIRNPPAKYLDRVPRRHDVYSRWPSQGFKINAITARLPFHSSAFTPLSLPLSFAGLPRDLAAAALAASPFHLRVTFAFGIHDYVILPRRCTRARARARCR